MIAPYLLVSDLHCHSWSAFSITNADGMNSRLAITLEELLRAADELVRRGGNLMVVAGDVFHVRGCIDPEVFNPTHTTFKAILNKSISVIAIPGNHDLKGNDTNELGNAIQTLGVLSMLPITFDVITNMGQVTSDIAMIPWCGSIDDLRAKAKELAKSLNSSDTDYNAEQLDLIIHAGIDGAVLGIPDHGLTSGEVASWGFRRVFAGHYHNHKVMEDGKVVSIGATTHQQWADIGSKAGFVFVYPDHIEWQASHAPSFIELTGETPPEEIPLIVDGNYVRVRGMKLADAEIKSFRTELEEMGAKGVTFQVTREIISARGVAPKASSLDESVDQYIHTLSDIDISAVKAGCADVLASVRAIR